MKIRIKDKSYRADLTMGAALYLKQDFGLEVDDVKPVTTDYLKYLYSCVKACAKADDTEFGFDFEQFCCILEPEAFNEWFLQFLRENEKARDRITEEAKKKQAS